jgi:nucleotide-binding universal stress UspA family protein
LRAIFKTVLVPTDFSEYAQKTLEYVWSMKEIGVERVVLMHATPALDEPRQIAAKHAKVLARLENEAADLRSRGFEVKTRTEVGTVYKEILKVAGEEDASMIVIGCHGQGFTGVVVGSVAERVTRESTVPVMLVKYRYVDDGTGAKHLEKVTAESFRKVFYPTDFSLCSTRTLEYVREFRKAGCEEVIIGSVIDTRPHRTGFDADQAQKETETRLNVIRQELTERGLKAKVIVRQGTPLEKLLDIAKTEEVSMIVLGSTGKGFFKEMLMGSVSESIVRRAVCPVLVIHDEVCTLTFD